jgi:hypothetical protein
LAFGGVPPNTKSEFTQKKKTGYRPHTGGLSPATDPLLVAYGRASGSVRVWLRYGSGVEKIWIIFFDIFGILNFFCNLVVYEWRTFDFLKYLE